jgi:hypothetical protein
VQKGSSLGLKRFNSLLIISCHKVYDREEFLKERGYFPRGRDGY